MPSVVNQSYTKKNKKIIERSSDAIIWALTRNTLPWEIEITGDGHVNEIPLNRELRPRELASFKDVTFDLGCRRKKERTLFSFSIIIVRILYNTCFWTTRIRGSD